MVRVRRFLIVRNMTGGTGGAQRCVLAVGMAGRTLLAGVGPGQCESRFVVVERCSLPVDGRVA